jgi:hypothetical protein
MTAPRVHLFFVAALLLALGAGSLPLIAQPSSKPDDVLLGIWRLDLTASRYSPGPAVRTESRTYTRDGQGILGVIERVHADDRKERIEYRPETDQQVPVSGARSYDAIRLKRVDSRTTEGILSHAGRVFGYSRRTISGDGRTMTITFRREEPGDMVNNIAVYRKQ